MTDVTNETVDFAGPIATGHASRAKELTIDAFLGGRVELLQPKHGYRAGIDSVLLAAATPVAVGGPVRVLDCGAGVGTVGLCIASCTNKANVVLLERDPRVAELARRNIVRNALSNRVRAVTCDLTRPADLLSQNKIQDNSFSHIVANPPFYDVGAGTTSPHALKAAGNAMPPGDLDSWVKFAARMARPAGRLVVIQHSAMLALLLTALRGRFGGIKIVPVYAHSGDDAHRVIVLAVKGSKAPLTVLPGLVLQEADGRYIAPIDAVLREGAPLEIF